MLKSQDKINESIYKIKSENYYLILLFNQGNLFQIKK